MVWWHCQQCQWREILFLYFHLLTKALASPAPTPDIFMASMSTDDTWPEILSVITVMSHLMGNCQDLTKPNSSLASMNVPCELDICFIETFFCICSFMLPVIGGPKVQRLKVLKRLLTPLSWHKATPTHYQAPLRRCQTLELYNWSTPLRPWLA